MIIVCARARTRIHVQKPFAFVKNKGMFPILKRPPSPHPTKKKGKVQTNANRKGERTLKTKEEGSFNQWQQRMQKERKKEKRKKAHLEGQGSINQWQQKMYKKGKKKKEKAHLEGECSFNQKPSSSYTGVKHHRTQCRGRVVRQASETPTHRAVQHSLFLKKRKGIMQKKKCGDFFVKKTSPQAHATLLFSFVL